MATGAKAVGLSVVYTESPPRTATQLAQVRSALPPSVPLLVGGPDAAIAAREPGAGESVAVADLDGLRAALRRLHAP